MIKYTRTTKIRSVAGDNGSGRYNQVLGEYTIRLTPERIGFTDKGTPLNQEIYRVHGAPPIVKGPSDQYILKIPSQKYRADSPFKKRTPAERAQAAQESYRLHPGLFPESHHVIAGGKHAVLQRRVYTGGQTFESALKSGDRAGVERGISRLRKLHNAGYIHGDIKVSDTPVGSGWFDNESFGRGDPLDREGGDLVKLYDEAEGVGRGGLVSKIIERNYGGAVLERLKHAA